VGGGVSAGTGGTGGAAAAADGVAAGSDASKGDREKQERRMVRREPTEGIVVGVQIVSGVCAGMTSGFMTTPLVGTPNICPLSATLSTSHRF
jgi:hypothetical protein